jgi:hypothetical protein
MKRSAFRLALTAALAALVLSGCGDDDEPTRADDPESTPAAETSDPASPTDEETSASEDPTTPAESETTDTAETVSAPIFFVGETPQGPRLFAEQRDVEADNPLEEAVAVMTAGDAADPDYRTLFPGGSFESIEYDGAKFVVTTADDAWNARTSGMSKTDAKLAVQQLVYTLQAVQGEKAPVSVEPSGVLFGLDAASVKAADELSTRGLVNVLSPSEGQTVSGSFTASGEASSFEATVGWQIRDESGKVVDQYSAMAEGWIDHLWPWEAEIDVSKLDPGTYVFVAMTDDPSGGEGFGPTEDTKTIVVE